MTTMSDNPTEQPVVVTPAALRRIERRVQARLRAYFRPGERIELSIEDDEDFVYAQMSVVQPDDSFQLDLEAAIIEQDQDPRFLKHTNSRHRMLGAIEFLADQLEEYFRNQRETRFHVDWRIYDLEDATVRFRGRERRPDLEEQASELLEDNHGEHSP